MKKTLLIFLAVISSLFVITRFSNKLKIDKNIKIDNTIIESEYDNNMKTATNISVTINKKIYKVILEETKTAQTFAELLPKEFHMNELNGNEKYVYMDNFLPTNSSNPKHIRAGDVMLYENNCLVIFYESFDTSYSYTKIGHIDNLPNLGNSDITIKFNLI